MYKIKILMKYFILSAKVTMITEIIRFSPFSIAAIINDTNCFNAITQLINPIFLKKWNQTDND